MAQVSTCALYKSFDKKPGKVIVIKKVSDFFMESRDFACVRPNFQRQQFNYYVAAQVSTAKAMLHSCAMEGMNLQDI